MRIGIIVHSHTGNTLQAAEELLEELRSRGHEPQLIPLQVPEDYKPGGGDVELTAMPDISDCEALVLGAPVHAFSLSAVMNRYLSRVDDLAGRPVAALITQHLPYAWLGGNRATRQLRKACTDKGGDFLGGAVINWSRSGRADHIKTAVQGLADRF